MKKSTGKSGPVDISQLLQEWRRGDPRAANHVVLAMYSELRRIARGVMRRERASHTLQPTALIHEAYIRLCRGEPVELESRTAFLKLMAVQMKRHLIDYARRRAAEKRGGGIRHDEIGAVDPPAAVADNDPEEFLTHLDVALEKLNAEHPRVAETIRLRFVADLSIEDAARALGVSTGTIKRDFAFGRAWLIRELANVP
jgi:RNA polymerase sigma factor (TIGR02999 family)